MTRVFPRPLKRIVVKIGSQIVSDQGPRRTALNRLIKQIAALWDQGVEVVLVSSGAIALGMKRLKQSQRPKDMASLQALAAVGQTELIELFKRSFQRHGRVCGQVLLTWDDFDDRKRYNNACRAILKMLQWSCVPVVNENDTVAVDEIKFGDNDRLSALVAGLVRADGLIILTDVAGFLDTRHPQPRVVPEIRELTEEIQRLAGPTDKHNISVGGMAAKLQAVTIATHARIPVVIASAHLKDVLARIVAGERVGTYFYERQNKLLARKHWIAFGAKPKGVLIVDRGAAIALLDRGGSLLLVGIVGCEGNFRKGEVVIVKDETGAELGRGIVRYDAAELRKDLLASSDRSHHRGRQEVIHRNDLVLNQGS